MLVLAQVALIFLSRLDPQLLLQLAEGKWLSLEPLQRRWTADPPGASVAPDHRCAVVVSGKHTRVWSQRSSFNGNTLEQER